VKHKKVLSALAAGAVAMTLLLGASTASAQTVIFGDSSAPTKATGISDLVVNGITYQVTFELEKFAYEIYGPFPGDFPYFNTRSEAEDAIDAVNAALQGDGATAIGEEGVQGNGSTAYAIGWESFLLGSIEGITNERALNTGGSTWISGSGNTPTYNGDQKDYAVFTSGTTPVESSSWGIIKSLYR
jgi:hypothetical protein